MDPFGGPVCVLSGEAADLSSAVSPAEDTDRVRRALLALNGGGCGSLRIYRPRPTAAFAPRDTTLPAFPAAAEAMRGRGFAPVERRAGGQLAVYDRKALVVDLVAPHFAPRLQVMERFGLFAAAIAAALRGISVDARVGGLAGEFCPGDYSVNGEGRIKLAGLAQRIGRCGYHLGAVIAIEPSEAARAAVAEAYRILGFPFDPSTFGAVADMAAGVTHARMREALLASLGQLCAVAGVDGRLSSCG